ncbi:MAG TPA: ATP-binding protein [Thermoanaerobaculia bacterium]|nr:ATP-binding protein [Thermoanaerobaculia bacterium]
MIDSISQAVIATDLEGKIVSWNHGAQELYGKNASVVIGRPLGEVVPKDDPLAEPSRLFEELRAGRSWSGARRVDHHGGLVFLTAAPIRQNTAVSGFVIVGTPLDGFEPPVGESERLRQREAQLRQAQQTARIASWGWHIPSDAIEGSAELLEILDLDPVGGLTLSELLTKYVHPDDRDRFAAACETARAEDLPLDVEHRFRTPGGNERILHLRGQRVLDQRGNAIRIVGVVQDVTERRRLENRLLQAERVSSLGRLAASVAHEFNNVLMGIQPFIDLLTRKAGSEPTVKMAAPRIADAVARGKRITQEILRFTRIAEPSRVAVNVAEWLLAFQSELEQLAGTAVTVTVDADPSLTMLADAHQLRQVFANMVVNAHHAMPNGGRLEVRAVADTLRNGNDRPIDAVHFTIADTGIGMPQDTLRYIFEPLFTTKKFGGTGIGLAVASQVVQQHEGHIFAESILGEGTTFHVILPAAEPAAVTPPRQPEERQPGHTLPAGTHVMMIEDDDSVGTGLAALLDYEEISVDWVRLGAEAVARIAARMPDAVIFDLGLPDVDGLTLYDEVASRWPNLPVLFSTGHGDENLLKNHVVGKHVGYLQKPYESDALLAELEKLLG